MLDNPLIKKPLHCHVWNILLLLAQHEKSEFIWAGEKCTIETGQLLTGRKKLSELSGISEAQVERILKYLELEHQITQTKTNKFRIITIVNWDKYQADTINDTTSVQQKDNKRTTEGQQKDTYKNDKNVKNEKNDKKNKYLDFVFLSENEHKKLIEAFGATRTAALIGELNDGIGSKGYRYKSHYHTILAWVRRKEREQKDKSPPQKCRRCGDDADYYGGDDNTGQQCWYCQKHKPDYKPTDLPQPQMKGVEEKKGLGERRNEQKDKLGVK